MSTTQSAGNQRPLEPELAQPDDPTDAEPLEKDMIFHLLQTERRRLTLQYLRDASGTVEMRDLAEQVAAWEHDTTVEALTSKQRQRVYIALYQAHLDAFADAGVIEYNKARGVIEPTSRIDDLYRYLPEGVHRLSEGLFSAGETPNGDRDTSAYFASASLFSTGLVTATWIGVLALPAAAVSAIIIALFTIGTLGSTLGV